MDESLRDPGRHLLHAGSRPVLEFTTSQQERPTAEETRALAPLHLVVPAIVDQLGGMWLSTEDDGLAEALLRAGASMVRHAHHLELDFRSSGVAPPRPVPASLVMGSLDRSVAELADLSVRSYLPEHPDFISSRPRDAATELAQLLSGSLIGPYMADASGQILDRGRLVAACVINLMPEAGRPGCPWVSNVFRDPDPAYRGFGSLLLHRAAAELSASGESRLGLAVSEGNTAKEVYEKLGFRAISSSRKLLIPER